MSQTTTSDVRKAFRTLNTVEFEDSDLANGVRVAVHEKQAGRLFQTLRQNGWSDKATTRRLGDTLVAHIPAEQEEGLGQLFG